MQKLDKTALAEALTQSYDTFVIWVNELNDEQFNAPYQEKWTIGQNLEHLIKSTKPVRALLGKQATDLQAFGQPTNAELHYQNIIDNYLVALQKPITNTTFAPENAVILSKIDLVASYQKELGLLLANLNNWEEANLDIYSIPHPLLGNLSVRQMLYFTIYHSYHHLENLKKRFI